LSTDPSNKEISSLGLLETSRQLYRAVEVVTVASVVLIVLGLVLPLMRNHRIEKDIVRARLNLRAIAAATRRFLDDTGLGPCRDAQGRDRGLFWLIGPGEPPTGVRSMLDGQWGRLEDHLHKNLPGLRPYEGWRGPYLHTPTEDPWGRAYLVVLYPMFIEDDRDCIVISAGPNGRLESGYSSPRDLIAAGDDLIEVIFDKSAARSLPYF